MTDPSFIAIEKPSKVITYNPTEINEALKKYYIDLLYITIA